MARTRKPGLELLRALDSVRFGDANILNLRDSLPSSAEAARRAEAWLRQKQVESVKEVLVITGRGNNSEGGVSPVAAEMERQIKLIQAAVGDAPGREARLRAALRAALDQIP